MFAYKNHQYSIAFPFILLYLLLASKNLCAEVFSSTQAKSALIFNFIKHIEWPDGVAGTSHYQIGILGENDALYRELKYATDTLRVRGKPLKLKKIETHQQAKSVHVLVLSKSESVRLEVVASALIKNGVLLISDGASNKSAMMINFTYPDKGRISFQINRSNIIYEGLSVSKEILLLGGKEIDVATIYKETEFALTKTRRRVEKQRKKLNSQQQDIDQKAKLLALQNIQITTATKALAIKNDKILKKNSLLEKKDALLLGKENRLAEKDREIFKREQALELLEKDVSVIKYQLFGREEDLVKKQSEIKSLERGIADNKGVLDQQKIAIDRQKELIESQHIRVLKQGSRIEIQQKLLYGGSIIVVVILTLVTLVYLGYRQKQASNLKLAQKNQELHEAMDTLKRTQSQLVQSEKMASLGQLVASVAHEVNTPLGAIKSSANSIISDLKSTLGTLPNFFDELDAELRTLFIKMIGCSLENYEHLSSVEERQHRRQLTRELTPLLQDGADNVADILVDMHIYRDIDQWHPMLLHPNCNVMLQVAYKLSGIERNAMIIDIASDKASKVVLALKTYSHPDQPDVFAKVQVLNGIETVLTLYNNYIKHGVDVTRDFDVLPEIIGSEDKLNQVWTNIIHNALQAMENRGSLVIRCKDEGACITIEFEDSGPGIPANVQNRIFEAFFTTKVSGEGTGIGLDISQRIVKKHKGEISFTSVPGRTVFRVELPVGE